MSNTVPTAITTVTGVTRTYHVNPDKGAGATPNMAAGPVAPALSDQSEGAFDYGDYDDPYETPEERTAAILELLNTCEDPSEITQKLFNEGWSTQAEAESGTADIHEMDALMSEAAYVPGLAPGAGGAGKEVYPKLAEYLEAEGLFRDVVGLRNRAENNGSKENFFNGYLEGSAFAAHVETNIPVPPYDLEQDIAWKLYEDASSFFDANVHDITSYANRYKTDSRRQAWMSAGRDFAFTRNSHGTGFGDRGLDELGDRLVKSSKSEGSQSLMSDAKGNVSIIN